MPVRRTYSPALSAFAKAPRTRPGFGAPTAPRPAAPSPPVPQATGALPIDLQVGVDTTAQGAQSTYANTFAQINQGQDRRARDDGFTVGYNTSADGNRSVANLSVDPTNPYSRAAALQRSYDQSRAGTSTSYGARGQLYSGALQNAQNENTRRFGEGDNALRQGFMDFIARSEGQRTQARTDASNATSAALAAAISAAAGRAPADPGPPPEAPPPPPGGPGSSPRSDRLGAAFRRAQAAKRRKP